MLNERYLHHYFSHLLQERYNLLILTGGYDPGEVLMNSTLYIPFFNRLPLNKDLEPYCEED